MKLYKLISESDGSNLKYTNLTPINRKLLQFILSKGINQKVPRLILKFIKDSLAITDLEKQIELLNLYLLNANTAQSLERGFLEMDKVVEADTTDYNEYTKVLSEFRGVPETLVDEEYKGQISDSYDTYLPEYRVYDVARGEYITYLIARDMSEARNAASTKISNEIDLEGFDIFSDDWLEKYIEPNEEDIRITIYDDISDLAAHQDEKDLRDTLFEWAPDKEEEYEYADYDIEYTKEEIKKLSLDIQEKEFKKDKVEIELISLEKDIERLDYYSDEETNYRDMEYSEEIEELQQRYNEYSRIFDELQSYLEESYKELDKHQRNLEDYKEIIDKYSGDNLIEVYVDVLTEVRFEEAMDDVIGWLYNKGLGLNEAIDYGWVSVDEDEVIEGAINAEGTGRWLSNYNGDREIVSITDEEGNNSESFYLYRYT